MFTVKILNFLYGRATGIVVSMAAWQPIMQRAALPTRKWVNDLPLHLINMQMNYLICK